MTSLSDLKYSVFLCSFDVDDPAVDSSTLSFFVMTQVDENSELYCVSKEDPDSYMSQLELVSGGEELSSEALSDMEEHCKVRIDNVTREK